MNVVTISQGDIWQGKVSNIEANANAALPPSVTSIFCLSCLSVIISVCLSVSLSVMQQFPARPGKAKRYCGEGSSLLIFPNAPTPVLSLGNCINIAVVLHAIVIIVKNTANIKKLALAVTSAIILFKGGCFEKHCSSAQRRRREAALERRSTVEVGSRCRKAYL